MDLQKRFFNNIHIEAAGVKTYVFLKIDNSGLDMMPNLKPLGAYDETPDGGIVFDTDHRDVPHQNGARAASEDPHITGYCFRNGAPGFPPELGLYSVAFKDPDEYKAWLLERVGR